MTSACLSETLTYINAVNATDPERNAVVRLLPGLYGGGCEFPSVSGVNLTITTSVPVATPLQGAVFDCDARNAWGFEIFGTRWKRQGSTYCGLWLAVALA